MASIDAFFSLMVRARASDLHLSSGSQPIVRIDGALQRVKYDPLDDAALTSLLYEIAPANKIAQFEETGDVDFAYEIPGLGRFRANYFRQARGVAAAFRRIPESIMGFDDLGLPAVLKKLCLLPKGLILITGPTGSGKSTTLAAMIDFANRNRQGHIVTIEDPIEFSYESISCLVNQREIGRDSKDVKSALRAALREDPDIILVGEMRDGETIELALQAADTGHLVFATLHTMSAHKTVDRIIESFPSSSQPQIRASLSESLRAVVAQTLLKRRDEPGRVAAFEVMLGTAAIRNLIRENKVHQIPSTIETSKRFGMRSLDDDLDNLVRGNAVDPMEAYLKANNKTRFRQFLKEEPDEFMDY